MEPAVGEGTALGGVHWGIAVDGDKLILPINDPDLSGGASPKAQPGVFTFDVATGKPGWSYAAKPNCDGARTTLVSGCTSRYGFSAALVVVDGGVVGATLGGEVIILDGADGRIINRIDTIGPIPTINKDVAGKGGSIDAHSISAGAGMLFINSGYGLFGQTAGNVMIAYKPKS